jgi:hypothetical protein
MAKAINLVEYDNAISMIDSMLEDAKFESKLIARINDMLHKDWVKLNKKYPET